MKKIFFKENSYKNNIDHLSFNEIMNLRYILQYKLNLNKKVVVCVLSFVEHLYDSVLLNNRKNYY